MFTKASNLHTVEQEARFMQNANRRVCVRLTLPYATEQSKPLGGGVRHFDTAHVLTVTYDKCRLMTTNVPEARAVPPRTLTFRSTHTASKC